MLIINGIRTRAARVNFIFLPLLIDYWGRWMDFQAIMKIKINNKRAQATVEYVLMIVLVAGLVLSLTQFSDTIDGKLASWKSGAKNKMAGLDSSQGTYDLSRADFYTPGLTPSGSSGGSNAGGVNSKGGTAGGSENGDESGGEGGGGAGGKGSAARKGGIAGEAGAGGIGVNAPGSGVGKNQGGSSGISGSEYSGEQYDTDREEPQYNESGYTESQMGGKGGSGGGEGKKEGEKGIAAGEEGKGASSSLIKRRQGEELPGVAKTLAEKDWSIGKFIIILLIIIFFIIVIVKSREMRQ